MSRPFHPRQPSGPTVRVNGKIRAREVRVIGVDGRQLGVLPLSEAINLARSHGVDLVEIAATAVPPVCRLVDFGKFRYEQAKKEKESKKHQHANKLKEIQLSCLIDGHDFKVKLSHAIDFLCEDMKVKVSLRFRGREMAHKEIGFQQVQKFLAELAPYAHPDSEPKLIGRGITVMLTPLPKNKRAKNPNQAAGDAAAAPAPSAASAQPKPQFPTVQIHRRDTESDTASKEQFSNNPFAGLDLEASQG